jgi:hypothetical protein
MPPIIRPISSSLSTASATPAGVDRQRRRAASTIGNIISASDEREGQADARRDEGLADARGSA